MPRLTATKIEAKTEFVLSVPLDLMNAMYFTSLADRSHGIDGWPEETRREMAPDLLKELDALYSVPGDHLGVMGQFGDHLWARPEAWLDVDSLLRYLNGLAPGMGIRPEKPGVQGLFFDAFRFEYQLETDAATRDEARSLMEARLKEEGLDPAPALAVFDDPKGLRKRMASLIKRFYAEHYEPDIPRRMPLLERSYAAHRREVDSDPAELTKRLSGRPTGCLDTYCTGPYERLYFAPSLDMGPYVSCSDLGTVHGFFYPCDAAGAEDVKAADDVRLARLYKALGDEQRLSILRMLRGREMFIQEIVERTGLHQSVVSRHLSFMHAVGLLRKRREGNMKYISINPEVSELISRTLDLVGAPR